MANESKVYAVEIWSGRLYMQSAKIETAGPKRITLTDRPGWNSCRQTLDRADASFTPADAVARFVAAKQAEIAEHEKAIAEAKRLIGAARALATPTAQDGE